VGDAGLLEARTSETTERKLGRKGSLQALTRAATTWLASEGPTAATDAAALCRAAVRADSAQHR
jgi:hypothetical protein